METTPPLLDYSRHNTMRWLRMFETMCARYRCRRVEDIAPETDDDLYLDGPGGAWLAEIVSVEFDENGALQSTSREALQKLGEHVLLRGVGRSNDSRSSAAAAATLRSSELLLLSPSLPSGGTTSTVSNHQRQQPRQQLTIAIDWFLNCRERHGERRQCFVRICRNYRMVTVMLLSNTTKYGELPPGGLAFSWYPDRLRPFIFILACELYYRRFDFEVLNLHYEPLTSSQRWRARQRQWWRQSAFTATTVVAVADSGDNEAADDLVVHRSNGSGDGWLELAREMHSRARWLRVINVPYEYEVMDTMITSRAKNGRIQYLWRDGRTMRAYGVNAVAPGTLINLRDLEFELARARSCVLTLCDFTVFHRRCNNFLLFHHNQRLLLSPQDDDDDDDDDEFVITANSVQTSTVIVGREHQQRQQQQHRIESLRETRYFVDHTGTLTRSRFAVFS